MLVLVLEVVIEVLEARATARVVAWALEMVVEKVTEVVVMEAMEAVEAVEAVEAKAAKAKAVVKAAEEKAVRVVAMMVVVTAEVGLPAALVEVATASGKVGVAGAGARWAASLEAAARAAQGTYASGGEKQVDHDKCADRSPGPLRLWSSATQPDAAWLDLEAAEDMAAAPVTLAAVVAAEVPVALDERSAPRQHPPPSQAVRSNVQLPAPTVPTATSVR